MTVEIDDAPSGEPTLVRASGELDIADDSLATSLLKVLSEGRTQIVVDLVDVSFIDSSVVRALVLAYREATQQGGWLRVVYTHHLIRRVIEICGLSELLPQFTSVDAAVRGVPTTVHTPSPAERQGQ